MDKYVVPSKMGKIFSVEKYKTEDGGSKYSTFLTLLFWCDTEEGEEVIEIKLPYDMVRAIKEKYLPDFESFRSKLKAIPEIRKDLEEEEKVNYIPKDIKGYG